MKKEDRDFLIIEDIKHFAVNGLSDFEAKVLQDTIDKIKKKRHARFDKTLSRASKIVASWPKWKRDAALGSLRRSV